MSTTLDAPSFNRRPKAHSLLAIITIIWALGLGLSSSAAAQVPPQTDTLELLSQTDWVTPGKTFDIQVKPTTSIPADQVELVLTVSGVIRNRSQFQQSIDTNTRISGTSVILDRHPLSEVLAADGTALVSLPIQDPTQKRFYLKNAGIYPLRVELRNTDTGDVLAHFVTHILNEPQPATAKLGVTTILPVQAPQSLDPQKPFLVDDQGRSIQVTTTALANHPTNPITLIAEPESLDRLRQEDNDPTKSIVSNLVAAQAARPVIRTTWAPLSSPSYEKELSGELDRQFRAGESILSQTFPQVITNTWAATDSLDAAALTALDKRGIDRIIVREQDLAATQRSTTLAKPFVLSTGKGKETFEATQADAGLSDHFADAEGSVLGAHRLLADLAVLWNDRPAVQRNVVVMPSRNWNPNGAFLETFLRGIENSPVVSPTSIDNLFATPVEGGSKTPLTQRLATISKVESQGFPASDLNEQRARLSALTTIATEQNQTIADLDKKLLLMQRSDLDNRGHKEWLSNIKTGIDKQLEGIHLPRERSIRLTARQGEIPVTVQNDNGYPVHVRVRLTGNKLEFPDGNERTVDATRQYVTERFAVVARTSGAFGVQVQLESPDGSVILQKSEITIRSTATSSVGLSLSLGAIAFLIIWWIRSAVKTCRKKAPST